MYLWEEFIGENDRYVLFANQMANQQMYILLMVDQHIFVKKKNISFLVLRNIDNEIECPILMAYVCPKCGATGKSAHTIKYCTALSENERVALPTVKFIQRRSKFIRKQESIQKIMFNSMVHVYNFKFIVLLEKICFIFQIDVKIKEYI